MVILGTLKGTYRVYSRYIRIPGSRAHTRHVFNLRAAGDNGKNKWDLG